MSAGATSSANELLAVLARRARRGVYEGFLNELGRELGFSPSRTSRALRALQAAGRVEVERRGHGGHPSQVRVRSIEPLVSATSRPERSALADRLLAHLHSLSDGGVVERPLVEVARQLRVGAPSVSRALGQLVDEGLARVDVVGTRSRPTRIELSGANGHDDRGALEAELRAARAEIARLRAQLDELRAHPAGD